MKHALLLLAFCSGCIAGCGQSARPVPSPKKPATITGVGGSCEGCEAIHESPVPFDRLSWVDTLPDFNEPGPKLEIGGIIYKSDGKTPAPDVVLYVYHTDQKGKYSTKGGETGWGKRHGYIRGWVRTNEKGQYKFLTLRPASYPDSDNPQHIHPTIKEPGMNEYWIDEFVFADDPLLTKEKRAMDQQRGGSGVLTVKHEQDRQVATRHIILGKNVPGYPKIRLDNTLRSGLPVGSNCPAFDPMHLSGADSGNKVCPMCKYGYGQGILVWFNHANLDQMYEFMSRLEKEMKDVGEKKLRVFLVYMNPFYKENTNEGKTILGRKLRQWCDEKGIKHVALLWVPSPVDAESCGLYQINPKAKNTVFVYRKRKIISKSVNIEYSSQTAIDLLHQL